MDEEIISVVVEIISIVVEIFFVIVENISVVVDIFSIVVENISVVVEIISAIVDIFSIVQENYFIDETFNLADEVKITWDYVLMASNEFLGAVSAQLYQGYRILIG